MVNETCSVCHGALVPGEWLYMAPEHRVYPGVACKVVYDCPGCGAVFTAGQRPATRSSRCLTRSGCSAPRSILRVARGPPVALARTSPLM